MKRIALAVLTCVSLVVLLTQVAWAAPPQAWPFIHIVQRGQNLSSIARMYGTTVAAIVQANGIPNPNRIYAGQRLVIPAARAYEEPYRQGCGYVYIVRTGDTLSGIAFRHGVSVSALVQANGIANPNRIYITQRLFIPCAEERPVVHGTYYRVCYGDTLSGIAFHFGVSTWCIADANNIANPNVIYAGQVLYIP
jgi:LysM repeat protein